MKEVRPTTVAQYEEWLATSRNVVLGPAYEKYYGRICDLLESAWRTDPGWQVVIARLNDWEDKYRGLHGGYGLLMSGLPLLVRKPYASFLDKTFRMNVVQNENWPEPPRRGWLLPDVWFFRVNDVVRAELVVKYLDGARYVADRCCEISDCVTPPAQALEARNEGYYAIHVYFRRDIDLPSSFSPTDVHGRAILELQITTQLKDTIRRLTHVNYERRRASRAAKTKWQWDLGSEEFVGNYVGHMMHFLEGVILDVRDKQLSNELSGGENA